jgi:hypothetical protein
MQPRLAIVLDDGASRALKVVVTLSDRELLIAAAMRAMESAYQRARQQPNGARAAFQKLLLRHRERLRPLQLCALFEIACYTHVMAAKGDPGDTASLLDLLLRHRERLRPLQLCCNVGRVCSNYNGLIPATCGISFIDFEKFQNCRAGGLFLKLDHAQIFSNCSASCKYMRVRREAV